MVFEDNKEQNQQEKDEQRKKEWGMKVEAEKKAREQLKEKKSYLFYGGVAAAVVVILVGGYFAWGFLSQGTASGAAVNTSPPPAGVKFGDPIHWHPLLYVNVCGKPYQLPAESGPMPGTHTHADMPKIHLETVYDPAKLILGEAMKDIGLKFDKGVLLTKKDGDICPSGNIGKVNVKSDGQLVEDYMNLPLRDGQNIEVNFG